MPGRYSGMHQTGHHESRECLEIGRLWTGKRSGMKTQVLRFIDTMEKLTFSAIVVKMNIFLASMDDFAKVWSIGNWTLV